MTLDVKYEKTICEKLLAITRVVYSVEGTQGLPSLSEVMRSHKFSTTEEIRDQIQENLDFINVYIKYMILDIEALRREKAELKEEKK